MNTTGPTGYWPSAWPGEDGGPLRQQIPHGTRGWGVGAGEHLEATSRDVLAATMVVLRDEGEAYLLRHTAGVDAISFVERFHPHTLEVIERSPDLPGGPTWPGGMAVHANGSLYVAFGRHLHRLAPDCSLTASLELPRNRPYNSFVILPDGNLALKDFAGSHIGSAPYALGATDPSELLVVEPEGLSIVARLELPEPSIARISADGDDVFVVGDTSLFRVRWHGNEQSLAITLAAPYRTIAGQSYGWDPVLAAGAAWFLDNGEGSERFVGTFRGQGISPAPLHLVRVDLASGAVSLTEICGLPNGLVANPPAVDAVRRIAVGYDSSNGVVAAFRFDETGATSPLWQREMNHACHPVLFADTGELVLCDHDANRGADQLVVLDIDTGAERARVDTGSPLQGVVFPSVGFERDLYMVTITTLSRVVVVAD